MSAYFEPPAQFTAGEPGATGRFLRVEELPGLQVVPGLTLTPAAGQQCMVSFVNMQPHTVAPVHAHPEEQIGTVIEGEYEFELNGEKRIVRRGDIYMVPPNVPHGARTFDKPCLALDIFAPPRAALLSLLTQAANGTASASAKGQEGQA